MTVRRYYQLARFRPGTPSESLGLVMKLEVPDRGWSSRELRSFGYPDEGVEAAGRTWLELMRRDAGDPEHPLPVMSLDRHLWEGLYTAFRSPVDALLLGPIAALRDLAIQLDYLSRSLREGPDLRNLVDGTQRLLSDVQKERFLGWLYTRPQEDMAALLTFLWRLPESEPDEQG